MILLPLERYKALESAMKGESPRYKPLPSIKDDAVLKGVQQKRIRRPKPLPAVPQPISQENQPVQPPPEEVYAGKKKERVQALHNHLKRNSDRIRFPRGEIELDGVKASNSNAKELTSAFVDGPDLQQDTPGWNTLMKALEVTDAPSSLYGRWKRSNKSRDWASLMKH